jgi:hypothetical protein
MNPNDLQLEGVFDSDFVDEQFQIINTSSQQNITI